ncbi:SET and MYND domain-containing protein 4 isoform X3 [Panicum hallii]|uniref:SET and MYND domain-containing protein 4 isoform X3 n=1 Tax=Panicum hallii TaxID=206008 RepID=UPI000DF4E46D|nr:SET and MYND domain-containing protein 4 isoform X3 [Panicum hallii]
MERLKSAVPAELRRAVGEGAAADLPTTTSRLLAFFDSLPLFHQVMRELTDPELALCRKDKGRAAELKGKGNACFSRREFGEALGFYSQALRHVPTNSDGMDVNLVSAIYANRASTMHKLGLFKESLRDCDRAIAVSSNYSKAWYRKGMVKASLKNYSSAIHDLEVALSTEMTSLGKSNIEQELKLILQKQENVNEVGTSDCGSKDADVPLAEQPQKVIIDSISTPNKGRGMASINDIPPASLIHVEDPLAVIIMKSSRETHCHFCFNEAPADVVFCPLCTIPIYCSKRCQEQAVGDISCNQDTYLEHECGGAHWAAVLPADIVLAGRIMARDREKRMLYGKSVASSGPNLDLVHHYDHHSPDNKLESQIYAIILLLCLQNHYRSDLSWTEDSLSQLVLLIFQIKVNSIAIVRMKSMDGGPELTVNKGVSAAEGANMCSVEQVRVAQAIYVSGSLFNHSCRPNVHAYFLSRTLVLRSTEFIKSGSPVELSYGPQAGEMHLPDRQKSLQENYYFSCQCSSCSELNLSDLVMNSFCCPQSNCLGAISESTYYRSKENFVHVSLGGSYVWKLSLPDVSKVGKDMEKVARSLLGNSGASLNIDPGCCMNCRSHIEVSSAAATSHREASKINRLKEITLLDKTLIPEALQSLKQLKKLRHPYSKVLAQAQDTIAEAFVKVGDQEQAQKHCKASIQILEKVYHPKHITIAHELIKLVSILLSLGDGASAAATFARAEAIFSLYYGSHMEKILAYMGTLKRALRCESTTGAC